jgi:hypothetical protein
MIADSVDRDEMTVDPGVLPESVLDQNTVQIPLDRQDGDFLGPRTHVGSCWIAQKLDNGILVVPVAIICSSGPTY